jgi:membrane protein
MLFPIFPTLRAAVWLLSPFSNPVSIEQEASDLQYLLPVKALSLVQRDLAALTARADGGFSIVGLLNLAIAFFTARAAGASVIEAINGIHQTDENRGMIELNSIVLLFTIVAVIGILIAVALVVILPGTKPSILTVRTVRGRGR